MYFEGGVSMSEEEKYNINKGLRDTLLEVIDLWLSLKFGNEGKLFLEKLKGVEDVEKLKEVKELIMKARTLGELEELLKALL
ncbi:MAG: hypothetical protein H5T91_03985 [Synergistetes bacterium]|nr:hypothetical protein [Synergistota bacterium]MDK2871864.1 hypothetical protein [bacterium]